MYSFTQVLRSTFVVLMFFAAAASAQKLKPEEIIAKHLESIGTAEARAAVKSQMAVGDAVVTVMSQKNQAAVGRIVMASAGGRNFLGLQLNANDYPGDKFSFDGTRSKVAKLVEGFRSPLTNFVDSNEIVLKDSLLGGVLASSWALNDIANKKVKLGGGGVKKVDGVEVYAIDYTPKSGSDSDITLYFEKDTFRHVRTEYKRTGSAGIGRTPERSSGLDETRVKVVETYGDFKSVNGLTLPHSYKFSYSEIGQRGTREMEWTYTLHEFAFNQAIDDKTFDADAK